MFFRRKWQNDKTSVESVALHVIKGIGWIAMKRISKMMTKGISKIGKEEISECGVVEKLVAYFQCYLLLKAVCLKEETIVLALANLLVSVVVIVAFRNLSLMVLDQEPLLVLH